MSPKIWRGWYPKQYMFLGLSPTKNPTAFWQRCLSTWLMTCGSILTNESMGVLDSALSNSDEWMMGNPFMMFHDFSYHPKKWAMWIVNSNSRNGTPLTSAKCGDLNGIRTSQINCTAYIQKFPTQQLRYVQTLQPDWLIGGGVAFIPVCQ